MFWWYYTNMLVRDSFKLFTVSGIGGSIGLIIQSVSLSSRWFRGDTAGQLMPAAIILVATTFGFLVAYGIFPYYKYQEWLRSFDAAGYKSLMTRFDKLLREIYPRIADGKKSPSQMHEVMHGLVELLALDPARYHRTFLAKNDEIARLSKVYPIAFTPLRKIGTIIEAKHSSFQSEYAIATRSAVAEAKS